MLPALDKTYAPAAIEPPLAERWHSRDWFHARSDAADPRPRWSLVIPPPNVTGALHMGHMLEHTLIDILARWHRMRGENVLWLPGTDHAGIATQMVVERELARQGRTRRELGREAFEQKVWEWKEQYGGTIKKQMIRLGASCDWGRERFTLDPGLSRAVREVFVRLWDERRIYRGRYMVNWCPRCLTALSDLEVIHEDSPGRLYWVRYLDAEDSARALVVATTRPETIPGDTAVAVHPRDARYADWTGRRVRVPLSARDVPVLADEIAQPEFGSGVVKITPAHDANDFTAGRRHGLEEIEIMDEAGVLNSHAGAYAGLDRALARQRILADLETAGLLEKTEDYRLAAALCQRCRTPVEPRLSIQWFVKVGSVEDPGSLANLAIQAVEKGHIQFVPENYAAIYLGWMHNIHDWCISRQLWWGHRIPAWYCDACDPQNQNPIVQREAPPACPQCGGSVRQDADVLDTWFSSALWPFSTLGWPDQTADLTAFYPTSLLVTGFDILFFWVARMIMMGCHFDPKHTPSSPPSDSLENAVPFRQVYIHALVRDAEKQKMSKTKGNVIDPLAMTEKYGTDAVRFTLASMAAPGTDIALSEERMAGYAAFANKIWNAARFLFGALNELEQAGIWSAETWRARQREFSEYSFLLYADQERQYAPESSWLLSRLAGTRDKIHGHLQRFEFHEAAQTVYRFVWNEFCDWQIEFAKLRFQDWKNDPQDEARRKIARFTADLLAGAFEAWLRLLHPFMPFLTEELWRALWGEAAPAPTLALAAWPAFSPDLSQALAAAAGVIAATETLQDLIARIRSLRAELRLPAAARPRLHLQAPALAVLEPAFAQLALRCLAGAGEIEWLAAATGHGHRRLGHLASPDFDAQLDIDAFVDIAAERQRLEKERERLARGVASLEHQLANPSFVQNARPDIVEQTRAQLGERRLQLEKIEASLSAL